MTGAPIDTRAAQVNGAVPSIGSDGKVSGLEGVNVAGRMALPAQSVTFVSVPSANNSVCR